MPTPPIVQMLPPRGKLRSAGVVLLIFCMVSSISSCEPTKKKEERTEPWRRGEARKQENPRKAAVFHIQPGQRLKFELPTRRTKPGGTLGGLSGDMHLDLDALESSSGEIVVDLNQLEVSDPPAVQKDKSKKQPAPKVNSGSGTSTENGGAIRSEFDFTGRNWSEEARRWLNLGAKVPEEIRVRSSRARYKFQSFRELSRSIAKTGVRTSPSGHPEGEVREVQATAVGELSLGSLSVHREVPLLLRFFYPAALPSAQGRIGTASSDDAGPEKIEVHLRGSFDIPLKEYGIEPRDEAGHTESGKQQLIGAAVGSTVRLSGELTLTPHL